MQEGDAALDVAMHVVSGAASRKDNGGAENFGVQRAPGDQCQHGHPAPRGRTERPHAGVVVAEP